MGEILTVKELTKTFKLSSKQQKLEKTGAKSENGGRQTVLFGE